MPEGDTIHKLVAKLDPALRGRRLEGLFVRDRGWVAGLRGARIDEVAALGKHMLFAFSPGRRRSEERSGGAVLHVHLGMKGRWHVHPAGAPWSRPRSQASAALQVDGAVWVCFRARVAELVRRAEVSALPGLRDLGPDLLGARWRSQEAVARARRFGLRGVDDLLLDQRVASGLGNVYKSEVLFLEGIHPATPVRALDSRILAALLERGRRLMAANLGGWRRTTLRPVTAETAPRAGEPRFWVYERSGEPCWRCGTRIEWARTGDGARPTWWCPSCQPLPSGVEVPTGSSGAQR